MYEIVRLHGVPHTIDSDGDGEFVSVFWERKGALGTNVILSNAFHPKTNGQSKRMIQTLKDMLRSCGLS